MTVPRPVRLLLTMLLLIAGLGSGYQQVSAISGVAASWQTVASVPKFFDLVLDEAHDRLFGTDQAGGQVVILTMSTLAPLGTISLGQSSAPAGIALSPDGTQLAVALSGFGNIALVDTGTLMVTGRLYPTVTNGPNKPYDVQYGRTGRLYSTGNPDSAGIDYIHTFDTATQIEVGISSHIVRAAPRLAMVPGNNTLYMGESSFSPQKIYRFDLGTDDPAKDAQGPHGGMNVTTLAVRADSSAIYSSNGQVWSGDLQRMLGAFSASGAEIEYVPATERLFISQGKTIAEVSALLNYDVLVRRSVAGNAGVARANAAGTRLYVSTDVGFEVLAVDTLPSPSPSPTPSPTSTPSSTPSPTPTPSPSTMPSSVPSPTPSPSLMPSPIPSPVPRPRYTLTVYGHGVQGASIVGGGSYEEGTVAAVTAIPSYGAIFSGWELDGQSVDWASPLTITMNANHTVVAIFTIPPAFSDVPLGQPYSQPIAELSVRGYLKGYGDGTFGPEDRLVRAQMAALIARAMAYEDTPVNPFTDRCAPSVAANCVDSELWLRVAQLAARNIARGYTDGETCGGLPPCYAPRDFVTHAQVLSFITRAMVDEGWWRNQPIDPQLFGGVLNGTGHERDVATYLFYTRNGGGIPDVPPTGYFSNWNKPATRGWFAQVFWIALSSQLGADNIP